MTFIVILISLLIERFFDWSHLRYWNVYLAYQNKLLKKFPTLSPYFALAFAMIPLLIIVGLMNLLILDWLYGFVELLFDIVILLFCFGQRNLWADAFACINVLMRGDIQFAEETLKTSFNITDIKHAQSVHQQLISNIFIEANRRVFSVIVWFIIFGPMGAVLYRCMALTADASLRDKVTPELSQSAFFLESILDWLPIRIFTILFALGGHFVQVFACLRYKTWLYFSSNSVLLSQSGIASLGYHDSLPEDGSAETHAISLLDRVFIIVLVIIAMMAWLI
ncbi:MAG TPA: regulatory signaling modulator protein AmpE [Gammaproteobacteria bacterium]|nr:regulatory signaling modulator protein AmpE [Gammaproteobacteria bacterium]